MSKPWAYVAHKGGYWCGVTQGGEEAGEFLSGFVGRDFTITTVFSRAEYDRLMQTLQHWHKSPEYLAKRRPVAAHPDLFEAGKL